LQEKDGIVHEGIVWRGIVKIGANAPCPCGSGNKYKYCCRGKNAVIDIRKMEESDIPYLRDMATFDKAEEQQIIKAIDGITKHNTLENAYIAESNGEIVGFVHGMLNPLNGASRMDVHGKPLQYGELINISGEPEFSPQYLYVKPKYRGGNIGVQLMEIHEANSGYSRFMVYHKEHMKGYYTKQGYTYGADLTIGRKVIT
jgi:GNAT superfamily N-acetyltransferase